MLASSSNPQISISSTSHPRRPPAHLSVSLRRDDPGSGDIVQQPAKYAPGPKVTVSRHSSDNSDSSEESTGPGLQQWFERSNKRPETGFGQNVEDNDPPYFLPRDSSSNSYAPSKSAVRFSNCLEPNLLHVGTNGSSADDYRSVIDDLTIENKQLKERLRKYEKIQNAHLEKDRLFEVKIHSLPARKRRELEDVLRDFATSIDQSTDEGTLRVQAKEDLLPYPSLKTGMTSLAKHPSSNSTSNSRPVDSAYASMSHSNSNSTPALNGPLEGFNSHQSLGKEHNVQSFLHNIPEGLFPKHPPVMSERQKKKIVVQRLEQLFTGYKGINIGIHSQPLQQQEVSNSAARAEQKADHDPMALEGIREAHILPFAMDLENGRLAKLSDESSNEIQIAGSSDESSPCRSPDQRPTRPLDLDPDRAQIPADNVEYIRHLGLSTPHFESEESVAETDAEGWIYLNLLINMAQLHIMNVTPDFVRTALANVSEKFQLSRDGKKVRWRGGTQGTHLSSDSGASSALHQSPHDSDDTDGLGRKRRKLEVGKFTSAPVKQNEVPRGAPGPFHYKPLFHHRGSSSNGLTSSDESDSLDGYEAANASGRISRLSKFGSRGSGSKGYRKDEGPIVFYSGAKFCTDLSGDKGEQGNIIAPLHVTGVGKDGYSNHTETALGCKPRRSAPPFYRTTSGSLLSSRPFRSYSKGPAFLDTQRPRTPELLQDDQEIDIDFPSPESPASSGPPTPLQNFEASGLGGTQPADHFAVRVQTRLTRQRRSATKVSRFSAPSPKQGKFGRIISKSSLDAFHSESLEDMITARLDSVMSLSPTPQKSTSQDQPVKCEVLATNFARLEPSQLPPPAGYYATTSSSEDGYEPNSSSTDVSHKRKRSFNRKSFASYSDVDDVLGEEDEDEEMQEDESSIDMLAQARALDPSGVAAREQEFEMEVVSDEPVRSAAATMDDSDESDTSETTDSIES